MKIQRIGFGAIFLLWSIGISDALMGSDGSTTEKEYPIAVPSIVDGTPFGVNGHEIKKIIFILKEIEKIIHGVLNPSTKQRKGKYILQEQYRTVEQLVTIEKDIQTLDSAARMQFDQIFEQVREDFIKINAPYLDQAQAGKLVTLKFMNEWAAHHKRENSHMLDWAKEKPGHEFESFRKNVTSFEKFYLFCNDLIGFLSDLIASCPRGWQQFIELQEKKPKQSP